MLAHPSQEDVSYLESLALGVNDPAIYLAWDDDNLAAFLASANGAGPFPPRPAYLPAGHLTPEYVYLLHACDVLRPHQTRVPRASY
jgi:hypothetical protein